MDRISLRRPWLLTTHAKWALLNFWCTNYQIKHCKQLCISNSVFGYINNFKDLKHFVCYYLMFVCYSFLKVKDCLMFPWSPFRIWQNSVHNIPNLLFASLSNSTETTAFPPPHKMSQTLAAHFTCSHNSLGHIFS
jgi:hypothetical protein